MQSVQSHVVPTQEMNAKSATFDQSNNHLVIFGDLVVGSTLQARITNPTSGSEYAFQWTIDGKVKQGAIGLNYSVTDEELGKSIGVFATRIVGYELVEFISSPPSGPITTRASQAEFGSRRIASIYAAGNTFCSLHLDGRVKCSGDNSANQLGDGTRTSRAYSKYVSNLSDVATLSSKPTCALLKTGIIKCWGSTSTPVTLDTPALATSVASSRTGHTCFSTEHGQAFCFGNNYYGQLGNGTTTDSLTPVQVSGLEGVVKVTVGYDFSCALLFNGEVKCWGSNDGGQIGTDDVGPVSTPSPVISVTDSVDLQSGDKHSCTINSSKKVLCWGRNTSAQLGNGHIQDRALAGEAVGLENIAFLSVGLYTSCAISTTQELKCWGYNGSNQVGIISNGGQALVLEPISVDFGLGSKATYVTNSTNFTCAIINRSDLIKCWGRSDALQLSATSPKPWYVQYFEFSSDPRIEGNFTTGNRIKAIAGNWDSGVSFNYSWRIDGVRMSETSMQYTIPRSAVGKEIKVCVEGNKAGYFKEGRCSAGAIVSQDLAIAQIPKVTGSLVVGKTLIATKGTWDPDASISYHWYRNGEEIPNATSSKLKITNAEAGKWISLTVLGHKSEFGYTERYWDAATVVTGGTQLKGQAPRIQGNPSFGSSLSCVLAGWDSDTTFSYQWFVGKSKRPSGTLESYQISESDGGNTIKAVVTAHRTGFKSLTISSSNLKIPLGNLENFSTPQISFSDEKHTRIFSNTGSWEDGVKFTYQWLSNGKPIKGANKPALVVTRSLTAKNISLKVTATKGGYSSKSLTSNVVRF